MSDTCFLCRRQVNKYWRWLPAQLRTTLKVEWCCLACHELIQVARALRPFDEESVEQKSVLKSCSSHLEQLHKRAGVVSWPVPKEDTGAPQWVKSRSSGSSSYPTRREVPTAAVQPAPSGLGQGRRIDGKLCAKGSLRKRPLA